MSAIEKTINEVGEVSEKEAPVKSKSQPWLNRALDFLSSVRFGIALLIILVLLALIGMLIVQQNVNGFDAYYASLTPAEKILFGTLGFFDIYHAWYFLLLLLILSLNIVLASIDHFPGAWQYVRRPKLDVQPVWLVKQSASTTLKLKGEGRAEVAAQVAAAARSVG